MSQILLNGELVDVSEANVSLLDRDIQLGMNVFETMSANHGVIRGWDLHMQRLQSGLDRLGIEQNLNHDENRIRDLLGANDLLSSKARVRLTVAPSMFLVQAEEQSERPSSVTLMISDFIRNEHSAVSGIKCGSYAENILALREGQANGADEVVFLNVAGFVSECATANIFVVKDGVLMTPCLMCGCLPGVTRELVLQDAEQAGIETFVGRVPLEDLIEADEVFITNTQVGLQQVTHVGDIELPVVENSVREILSQIYHHPKHGN